MIVAMHAPDGFLEPGVAVVTAVISVAVVAWCLRTSSDQLGDRQIPLAGIAAAFVFAAQMVNFPVAAGTTGHLLGGALAAILLGPAVGCLVVAVVVAVQALVFADGGLTALGYNTLNMAVVTAFGGWALFRLFRRLLPADVTGITAASALAAGASVVLSAATFSLEWLFGASAPVPFDTVFGSMVGIHVLIGIGEAVITGMVIGAVLASRPDLVAGADGLVADAAPRERSLRPFVLGAVIATVAVAAVVSQFAASNPDGLERVATDEGFAEAAGDHALSDSLFADYATQGIDNTEVSLAVAGLTGAALSLAVGFGLFSAARLGRSRAAA